MSSAAAVSEESLRFRKMRICLWRRYFQMPFNGLEGRIIVLLTALLLALRDAACCLLLKDWSNRDKWLSVNARLISYEVILEMLIVQHKLCTARNQILGQHLCTKHPYSH